MRKVIVSIGLMFGILFAPMALSTTVGAVNVFKETCPSGSTSAICADKNNTGTSMIRNVIDLLFYAIGVISVIVIIIGGIKFITADGDSSKIKSARETILYAVVGLIVALLAFAIVEFTVNNI